MSLDVRDLSFAYGDRPVLQDISFKAEYGQFLSVLGPNGVGKSTLFKCMLGLLPPRSGGAYIDGAAVSDMAAAELARKMAWIPQSHSPVFNFSVLDMVLMGTTAQTGPFASPGRKQLQTAEEALERLGIGFLRDRGYGSISGGERQLVLIARAMAQQAKILVMDEPSASLDFGNRMKVMETVRSLTRDGYAVIQSTHDPDQAYLWSDRVLALHSGRVLAHGTPRETVTAGVISTLYGTPVEVHSLDSDRVRVVVGRSCLPAGGEGGSAMPFGRDG